MRFATSIGVNSRGSDRNDLVLRGCHRRESFHEIRIVFKRRIEICLQSTQDAVRAGAAPSMRCLIGPGIEFGSTPFSVLDHHGDKSKNELIGPAGGIVSEDEIVDVVCRRPTLSRDQLDVRLAGCQLLGSEAPQRL